MSRSPHIWVDKDKLEFRDGLSSRYIDDAGEMTLGSERRVPVEATDGKTLPNPSDYDQLDR